MTTITGTPPVSNQSRSNHQQYNDLGAQQPVPTKEATSQQASTKALAITSRETKGTAPPPLMGSAIVLANDSALHCFGGRLENRDLTNCHYVLDVETGYWQTIHAAPTPVPDVNTDKTIDPRALFSLSLSTDPVNTNSVSLSEAIPIPPCPRYFHTLNAYGTSVIVFGGMGIVQNHTDGNDSDNEGAQNGQLTALDDLHVYDVITQRWQQKRPPVNEHTPRARWAHMATILDHFLVVIGGTDSVKAYVEDACVLDLHTWEWVASVKNIGQCGSYRTVAATGPSVQASSEFTPSSHSFPSAAASPISSPQVSSTLSWLASENDSADIMASISMILSGRISIPSSTSSSLSRGTSELKEVKDSQKDELHKKTSERLASRELTPSFKTGKDLPSIYLYSNYNFHNTQREFKVITPQYTQSSSSSPSFKLVNKSETLEKMSHELPPGLRFPQAHVYQNQLVLTGTLIIPGNAPTLAIYTLNLTSDKWERLETGPMLQTGSWNRTLLHSATGTLFIFGNHESNPDQDYSSRTQHHDHIMMVDLQAYGLYERPIPSFLPSAQDLGQDLLMDSCFSDMHIASVNGKLFDANSTVLAARWPEFATMLLSPPYVTPLVLELPVPDEVVPIFLHYIYTGALPLNGTITPGVADHLLILARQYELNGLHALTLDVLHQSATINPVRIHSCALMAGELGLQARAVSLAMKLLPPKTVSQQIASPQNLPGQDNSTPPPAPSRKRPTSQAYIVDKLNVSASSIQNRTRSPSLLPNYQSASFSTHPMSFMSTSSGGSSFENSPMTSPGLPRGPQQHPQQHPQQYQPQQYQQQYQQPGGYFSSMSPNTQHTATFSSHGGYLRNGPRSEGIPSIYSYDEHDDGHSTYSSSQGRDTRAQQAKMRLQMQMQMQPEVEQRSDVVYHNPGAAMDYYPGGQSNNMSHRSMMPNSGYSSGQIPVGAHLTVESADSSSKSNSSKATSIKSSTSDKEKKKGILAKMKPPKPTASGAELMKSAGF
ncbi:hypothetical protein BGX27_004755 [Mortierella sp. AM989]|nr:hypothetical protein BGX27_004755 [Mortierella sp. AM989]